MCGRYALYAEGNEELREILDRTEGKYKTGEIFPTDKAPILVQKNGGIRPVAVSWGFPAFKGKGVIINARAETVLEKPLFRNCLAERRCVIPSSGFYEWSHSGEKIKYQFHLPQASILYMAGLYQVFDGIERFVILTTAANRSMEDIHNRMPVVLDSSAKKQWLLEPTAIGTLLAAAPPELAKAPA